MRGRKDMHAIKTVSSMWDALLYISSPQARNLKTHLSLLTIHWHSQCSPKQSSNPATFFKRVNVSWVTRFYIALLCQYCILTATLQGMRRKYALSWCHFFWSPPKKQSPTLKTTKQKFTLYYICVHSRLIKIHIQEDQLKLTLVNEVQSTPEVGGCKTWDKQVINCSLYISGECS